MALSDPDQKNRIIWSAKEKTVTVDAEEKLVIRIGGNQLLTLEQEKLTVTGALTIKAEKIMIEAESITAETAKDTILKGDNIRLSPKQKLRIEGSKAELVPNQGMTIKTGSLQAEGTTLELKATASGKLNSSGILELKGAMIKMN